MAPRRTLHRLAVVATVLAAGLTGAWVDPAEAVVTAVKGYACGYSSNVGLSGGPQAKLGCEPQAGQPYAPASLATSSPSVTLPQPNGSASAVTAVDPDGASAVYGPATLFGGIWPPDLPTAPPSGPISVSTQGTAAGGTVTSSADIVLDGMPGSETPNDGPGGFGPDPVQGDALHVECSGSETSLTGSTTITNGVLTQSTDSAGNPVDTEPIPVNPFPNDTYHGVVTHTGEIFSVVFNEQIIGSDGSLTVNAVHMYLFGPTAIGEVIKGQVICGTTPSPRPPSDTVKPSCSIPVAAHVSPSDPTPQVPRKEIVGVFDAGNGDSGGLYGIHNIRGHYSTVYPGVLNGPPYTQFVPPMRGPLQMTAEQLDIRFAPRWSFDVTDQAGNHRHCRIVNGHLQLPHADFDGDGRTRFSVFRPGGFWFEQFGLTAHWGTTGDIPVPGDYDNDGDSDVAVFRPSNGVWFVQGGSTVAWGTSADIPVPADYDGDTRTEMAVFRPSSGVWFVKDEPAVAWGVSGDIPVPADYNNDGRADIAVYRNGTWFINGGQTVVWGTAGDIPVPADYDGDGDDDIAVFRPSSGTWFVNGGPTRVWGTAGDIPVPADYDGSGADDFVVFRPSNGAWFASSLLPSEQGGPPREFGTSGDVPLPLPDAIRRFYFPPL